MRYKLRVTLTGIKGFYRLYELEGSMTLYDFHKQLRADLEFPQDQLILFKSLDKDDAVVARYGLFDLGAGTVDEITIAEAAEKGITHFVYFYDVTNKKSVNIAFEGEPEEKKGKLVFPVIVDTKGPNPIEFENGYVAYEDLPDDQKHLPGENSWAAAGFGSGDDDDEDDDDDDDDVDLDDEDDEDDDEDGKEIFDENESL